ncbi:MAG TPA: LuxR C-terminal-related transcriptional regulator [Albitalea sp.]
MSPSSQTGGELETLSRVINQLRPSSDFVEQLDRFTAALHEVIPFDRCVVLHERTGRAAPRGFVYVNRAAGEPPCRSARHAAGAPAIDIEAYLACFATSGLIDHAFHWHDTGAAPADLSPCLAEALMQMRGGRGVAASVRSTLADGVAVGTLLQFACDALSQREKLLASFIALHLHLNLTVHAPLREPHDQAIRVNLTGKERDVLKWVVEGKTSWEIGRILSTSERTVKFHLKNVYAKLNVSNRAQAAAVVNRLGLI